MSPVDLSREDVCRLWKIGMVGVVGWKKEEELGEELIHTPDSVADRMVLRRACRRVIGKRGVEGSVRDAVWAVYLKVVSTMTFG